MPYRSELKRPDLKGNFPCSVCGKMFCHSSSLSRHRMQAHFKSYTCTLCHQEINTNETLRSHLQGAHQVSRMFMCRCCNWAFPDKTSLHIHMQAMARNGTPGDVQVLAKSSVEEGELTEFATSMDTTDDGSPVSTPDSLTGNIFPAAHNEFAAKFADMQQKTTPKLEPTNPLLAQWMANNGVNPLAALMAMQMQNQSQSAAVNPNLNIMALVAAHQKRAALDMPQLQRKPELSPPSEDVKPLTSTPKATGGHLENLVARLVNKHEMQGASPIAHLPAVKLGSNGMHSPSGSTESCTTSSGATPHAQLTTVTSSSTSSSDMSPSKTGGVIVPTPQCDDCHSLRSKLALKSNNCRYLESKATSQESKISRLEAAVRTVEGEKQRLTAETDVWRAKCDRAEKAMLRCQTKALLCLQGGGDPLALKGVFDELLQVGAQPV